MDWFLHDKYLRHKRVNDMSKTLSFSLQNYFQEKEVS